jgi:hypothetical protein
MLAIISSHVTPGPKIQIKLNPWLLLGEKQLYGSRVGKSRPANYKAIRLV